MILLSWLVLLISAVLADIAPHDHNDHAVLAGPLPVGPPQELKPVPTYARNDINNRFGTAPDKGILTGPVLGSLDDNLQNDLHRNSPSLIGISQNASRRDPQHEAPFDDYWLSSLGFKGQMHLAPSGYQFFQNVRDFGAVGDGVTDNTAAINRAAAAMSRDNLAETRCGADCGSTSTLGALVYFPPGTYLVSSPIIQYYYTQFVGHPVNRPVIKGSANFTGIALIDNNMYIPTASGRQWAPVIRNFVFDLTGMAEENWQGGQRYVPTGVHWQVGQATSINNCVFNMTIADLENGSGGVISDVVFQGGNIGFFAGSQQFTATNLRFVSCLTAVKHPWNWGFLWKTIYVSSCLIAFDCSDYNSAAHQNTGSITVLDSLFKDVPQVILVPQPPSERPAIVLDNISIVNSPVVVQTKDGDIMLQGSTGELSFDSWATGYQFVPGGSGSDKTGFVIPATNKSQKLLSSVGYYLRLRPTYESEKIIVATDYGVANNASGDQSGAINALLSKYVGSVVYFPAGIYVVNNTVHLPVGSRAIGSGWSQIMGTGEYFDDVENPKVMVRVGNESDSGVIEISDMMFTMKAPSSGYILMDHFRVGGATGSDLQAADCPPFASDVGSACMAAQMLMHVTRQASGYFDNLWLWVADHDLDSPGNVDTYESEDGVPINANETQISVYAGRGMLIESQGPVWLYGVSSEHAQMYQFSLTGASNIYMGHIQTESPYYQPNPNALQPYYLVLYQFPGDPTFDDYYDDQCRSAWGLRIINSTDIVVYSAGLYSFFRNNTLGCTKTESCQLRLVETSYSERLWLYNIFTKGNVQIISPRGSLLPVFFNDTTRRGYASAIAAWLVLALDGSDQGVDPATPSDQSAGPVLIDPAVWQSAQGSNPATMNCYPPCTYVLPPIILSTLTTITFPPSTTSLEVGWSTTVSTVDYVSVTVNTTLTVPPLTTSIISWSNILIPPNVTSSVLIPSWSIVPPPFVITDDSAINGTIHPQNNTRTITPKPWPWNTASTSTTSGITPPDSPSLPTSTAPTSSSPLIIPVPITHTIGPPGPLCTGQCGSPRRVLGPQVPARAGAVPGRNAPAAARAQAAVAKREAGCWGPLCLGGGLCTGVLGCPPGICFGALCGGDEDGGDFADSDDPNLPLPTKPDSPDEPCTTRTYGSRSTWCIERSRTAGCASTCRDVVGCDTSGVTIASTVTPAPVMDPGPGDDWTTTGGWMDFVFAAQNVVESLRSEGRLSDLDGFTGAPVLSRTSLCSMDFLTPV
ncbi:pectin lyase-like protein [Hypoxylon crocopeplum]|nr:pectin lyase-like protein [Hypoxylon crocopeplum]